MIALEKNQEIKSILTRFTTVNVKLRLTAARTYLNHTDLSPQKFDLFALLDNE